MSGPYKVPASASPLPSTFLSSPPSPVLIYLVSLMFFASFYLPVQVYNEMKIFCKINTTDATLCRSGVFPFKSLIFFRALPTASAMILTFSIFRKSFLLSNHAVVNRHLYHHR